MQPTAMLWDETTPLPPVAQMPLPDRITHVVVERASAAGYHYLHESALAFHAGALYVGWANSGEKECNTDSELYRGRKSMDGGRSWSEPFIIAPGGPDCAHNHGVMLQTGTELWTFVARHDAKALTGMEAFRLEADGATWASQGIAAAGFIPFDTPKRLANGSWIIAGETSFKDANPAVALCETGDLRHWRVVSIPVGVTDALRFPETTVLVNQDGSLRAISRYEIMGTPYKDYEKIPRCLFALVASSQDHGQSWSATVPANLPIWPSKPLGGRLSNGQPYLIFNASNPTDPEHKRNTLAIAVGRPGADNFCRIWRIRHGASPVHAFYQNTQWAYPSAVEHDGELWISYSINKSDCGLSILPLSALAIV